MEKSLAQRNEAFQKKISDGVLLDSDKIVGFDTSSWIVADRAKKLQRPFFLDQSIAHPRQKFEVFASLRHQYPKWDQDIPEKGNEHIELEEKEYDLAHRIVAASNFTRDGLIRQGIPAEKILLNPYGVSGNFFRKKERPVMGDKVRFIYLGTLGARKGLPVLLDAWMDNHLYSKAELWLAGPASDYAKESVSQIPGIMYKGRLPYSEIPGLLDASHCLVFPSFFEGFGQVILEAMAAGLPVITTEATAGPDIIENGVDGFIIQSGDKSALGKAMLQFIEDPQGCYAIGQRAQEKAMAFSWDAYGDRWNKILDSE